MAAKGVLRTLQDGLISFYCPGCNERHTARIVPKDGLPCWRFNGNFDKPTFEPSLLIRSGHYVPGYNPDDPCWCTYNKEHPDKPSPFKCEVCHSFIVDGEIRFLNDCTHELAGQTVPLQKEDTNG